MRLFVNRSKVEQSVHTPNRQILWLKPGEGVEGEHYAAYSGPKSLKEEKPGSIDKSKIKASHNQSPTSALAGALLSDPKLMEAVVAAQQELVKQGVVPPPGQPPKK